MLRRAPTGLVCVVALGLGLIVVASAHADTVALAVATGTPLHVALDRRTAVKTVGQVITGTLVEPVYAYDRVVLPAGVAVRGHVAALEQASQALRVQSYLSGDFSPHRHIVLQFDIVTMPDGHEIAIRTVVTGSTEQPTLQVAAAPEQSGVVARARQEVAQRTSEAIHTITAPGKKERIKDALIDHLPYHPQFLRKGTVFTAELLAPIDFGTVESTPLAAAGTRPAPESLLSARLLTTLDSEKTARGAPIKAIVTHPVFSAAHELILPEGVILEGTVTFAKPARHFRRNGQLRFLFQQEHAPDHPDAVAMLASLYAVRVSEGDAVAVDEEGGASVTNSNTRFIAPALSILALRAAVHREYDNDAEDIARGEAPHFNNGNPGLGGFFGFGVAGIFISQIARPVGIGLSLVGAVRSVYGAVFAKGRNVVFPANTPIQLQLAPGPTSPARPAGTP